MITKDILEGKPVRESILTENNTPSYDAGYEKGIAMAKDGETLPDEAELMRLHLDKGQYVDQGDREFIQGIIEGYNSVVTNGE